MLLASYPVAVAVKSRRIAWLPAADGRCARRAGSSAVGEIDLAPAQEPLGLAASGGRTATVAMSPPVLAIIVATVGG